MFDHSVFRMSIRENIDRVSERVIQAIWNYLFIRVQELHTTDGIPIRILDQGMWNDQAGPDFHNAKLRIGDEMLSGDVEIHHRTSDWFRHHHDRDPAYGHVILHVVMDHDCPCPMPVLVLRPFLTDRLEKIVERVHDLHRKTIFCHDHLDESTEDVVRRWVQQNGRKRFFHKSDIMQMARGARAWEEMAYLGMMEALGYSSNRDGFRTLARRVPYAVVREVLSHGDAPTALMRLQAVWLGAGGFLSDQVALPATEETIPFVNRLQAIWQEYRMPEMVLSEWRLSRLRPANFPPLRMAGLAKFLVQEGPEFLKGFQKDLRNDKFTIHRLCIPSFGYWSRHHTWSPTVTRHSQDLIGAQRAVEIMVNVILPILYAAGDESDQKRVLQWMDRTRSLEKNRMTRIMQKQLRLRASPYTVTETQGLIELHRRCFEFNCADCSVFERIVENRYDW